MRAVVLAGYGGPEVLRLAEVEPPVPGPDEILVDVVSTALNRADLLQRMGRYPGPEAAVEILGLEFAGRVAAVGARVGSLVAGDPVMGLTSGGSYAEQLVTHERMALRPPAGMALADAAAIPEVWITAWDALVCQGGLTSGRVALVHGGGSGVGTAAIQLARALGATVVATASAPKLARCRALGADLAVDYRGEDFVEATRDLTGGRGADVVVDIVGGDNLARNLSALAVRGSIVQVGLLGAGEATVPLRRLMAKRARLVGTVLRARPLEEKIALSRRFAREVLPLFESGRLRTVIDRRYGLDEVVEAHIYMQSNASFGKILLDVAMPEEVDGAL
ncbi:MAG: NAD(P)H-quinone oxidoreductase [bacterium]|nr:NAD(P)H-quinone oxidoreductase [bacterium]MXV89394.1 NAD(P)H-quinone oxidoreductase [Acidimicrobiia bacterium]MYC44376.1 NAD(P)H-quinone oxidoreductase [Acidimicrobiia bacterium]